MSFGQIKITNFALRHFDPKAGVTKITDIYPEEFESAINDMIDADEKGFGTVTVQEKQLHSSGNFCKIMDGYAPFCKLIAVPNFTNARVGSLPITIANHQYIRHGYSSRNDRELPVLTRWFELPTGVPLAEYLVIVVYSRKQLLEEHQMQWKTDMNSDVPEFELAEDDEWGVVAILGQSHPEEEPMNPVTMMRNALGKEEGGSGTPLDKEKYAKSVLFWQNNVNVKS